MPDQVLVAPARPREGDGPLNAQRTGRPGPSRRPGPSAARRRRVLSSMVATTAVLALVSVAVPALAWAALAAAALTVGYLVAAARVRHRAVRAEMARAFGAAGGGFDWSALVEPGEAPMSEDEKLVAVTGGGSFAVVRFALAYLLGWALTPAAVAIHLLTGDRRDLDGDGVLARIVALQRRGRAHSVRALAVSLATTAGVTAVGGMTGLLAAPAASAAAAPATYTVAPGDTLAAIAAAHGTTVAALAAANHLTDPNLIYPGQVLDLAGGGAAATPVAGAAPTGSYTVRAGDTLGSIASRYGTTWEALAAANHLSDPNLIFVGEVLAVSGSAAAPAPATPATATPAPATTTAPAHSAGSSYTVESGDTLGSIAARFGTSWQALAAANHLSDPNLIYVGEVLTVGGAGAVTTTTPAGQAPAPAPSSSSLGARALAVALEQIGKPYQWAGAGPDSFDCSGLVRYAYAAVGVSLDHYTVSQYQETTRISESELQPGDLVFWGGTEPYHVAMYDGNGNIVVADTTGTLVRVEPMTWDGTPSGFGRVG